MFRALVLNQDADGGVVATVEELDDDALPEGDVTVDVEYSTVNYKDSLAICNGAPVVRTWPLVPGIDFAGTVQASTHADFAPGQAVVLNGWGVGESHWGGLSQRARVSGDWLVALPASLTTAQAMAIGTAGYTAMLCVLALERHGVAPGGGTVLVTGAAGGVGSVAIALLAAAGYEVAASTGRASESDYLTGLGASEIIDRSELSEPGRPMQKARFAGAIDTVGSHTLANVCAQTQPYGCVAACGNAQGMDFPSSVAPFILRGVTLAGIDSVNQPKANRVEAWDRLAADLDRDKLAAMTETIGLADVPGVATRMLEGGVRGRIVVDPARGA